MIQRQGDELDHLIHDSTLKAQSSLQPLVINVRGLSKRYGKLAAVREVDFAVRRGEIFGLIGPDGAGKTTTFQILAGVMEATSGNVQVLGRSPREARLGTGYLTQQFSLYLDLSVDENLRYSAGLRQVPPERFEQRRDHYLTLMNLDQFGDRLAGQLSGGMKQKLALCCALVSQPEILLLDEPTTGVDPVSRREFWDILAALANAGVTIVVATPYLDEAERCNHIALMYEGEIQAASDLLKTQLDPWRVSIFGDRLHVVLDHPDQEIPWVRELFKEYRKPNASSLDIHSLRSIPFSLEDSFISIVQRVPT
jgi:ABC-2 type transport system ATP-binding protein